MPLTAILALLSLPLFLKPALSVCPPQGRSYPRPSLVPADLALSSLSKKLDAVVNALLSGSPDWPTYETVNTSFSIQVTSNIGTLWESHHTAKNLGDYQDSRPLKEFDGDSVYRVASVSKILTVLGLLLQGDVNWQDPVTKWVPELVDSDEASDGRHRDEVDWDSITLEALGSQLSGILRDYSVFDMGQGTALMNHHHTPFSPEDLAKIGFPDLSGEDPGFLRCGQVPPLLPCGIDNVIQHIKHSRQIFDPFQRSTYSDVNFVLLGFILSRMANSSYVKVIQESILDPLDMRHTYSTKPADSSGVIPSSTNAWQSDFGDAALATTGYYSSANDLSKLLRSILNHEQLTRVQTNAWFRPRAFQQSLSSAYGMPWEIFRVEQLTGDGHVIDIYTKLGIVMAYSSIIMLIPEYNLGITILTAGDSLSALHAIINAVVMTALPEIESIQRTRTRDQYAGYYRSSTMNSSMRLDVSEHTGVAITQWISNGVDFLSVFKRLRSTAPPGEGPVRLYPTGTRVGKNGELWLAVLEVLEEKGEGRFVLDELCMRNFITETFAERQIADVVIRKENGEVTGMYLRGLRVDLVKSKKDEGSNRESAAQRGLQRDL